MVFAQPPPVLVSCLLPGVAPDDEPGAHLAQGAGRASCSDTVGLCSHYQRPKCNLRWNLH